MLWKPGAILRRIYPTTRCPVCGAIEHRSSMSRSGALAYLTCTACAGVRKVVPALAEIVAPDENGVIFLPNAYVNTSDAHCASFRLAVPAAPTIGP